MNKIKKIKVLFLFVFFFFNLYSNQFVKSFGWNLSDGSRSVIQAPDNGFVVAGYVFPDFSTDFEFYITKFNSSGNILWTKNFGGSDFDIGNSVSQILDGGYVITGFTWGFGAGMSDILIAKFDSSGNFLWAKALGGSDVDDAWSVIQTSDAGFLIAGYTRSFGAGNYDILLAKFDSSGDLQWARTLGGADEDKAMAVIQTDDGGYAITGYTYSFGGIREILVAKIDSSGDLQWARTIGDGSYAPDEGWSIIQSSDSGILVTGFTSLSPPTPANLILAKFNSSGSFQWAKLLGGNQGDGGKSLIQTSDEGFVVAGWTDSYGAGQRDFLLAKFDSSGNFLWASTLGGIAVDETYSVTQSQDGGFVVAGYTFSFGAGQEDIFIAKFDSSGNSCISEPVNPTVTSASPTITSPSPNNTSPSLTITSPNPTIASPSLTLTVVCELDIEEYSKFLNPPSQIFYVPSFFKNHIKIQFPFPLTSSLKINIYNISGSPVFMKSFFSIPSFLTLKDERIREWPSGIYFLSLTSDKRKLGQVKLIKP